MSTRHARTADRAQNEKNTAILKGLLQQPGNKYCADCKRKDPRWASWNLGIFVCIRCSGIHRSMGTHISKVKSVDLDSWIPPQIESMEKWGNERANMYWEANLKDNKPNESNMDMWIRSKYELKRWAMKGPIPDPSSLKGNEPVATPQATSPAPKAQVAPTKAKPTEFNSLDDFFGSSPSSSTTTTHSTHNGNGKNGNSPMQQLQSNDLFSSMKSSPQKEPAKPQIDFKSSIMSLYSKQPAGINTTTNQSFSGNGNYQHQLSGLSGFSMPAAQAPQPSGQDNGWGSFVSSSATITPSTTSQAPTSQIFGAFSPQQQQSKKQAYDAFADLLK